ncbi:CDP-glycerol glycerophosphotransferase family protein [Demequina muriae]|uniref:CDP-glycerol glycerophosphotransferase family protein n=1 Tax=Demequina muriae TaxID=3051664 RepID=A0ABT8GIL0_9MICO|nr:CDP-glycerol glycerophosphotransferase family protein [Demequina sp. EGI L300058]MDN4481272.1 CDP-glycerol glycerophosphotransferase family protein [Demequina sp. EGI L300058]
MVSLTHLDPPPHSVVAVSRTSGVQIPLRLLTDGARTVAEIDLRRFAGDERERWSLHAMTGDSRAPLALPRDVTVGEMRPFRAGSSAALVSISGAGTVVVVSGPPFPPTPKVVTNAMVSRQSGTTIMGRAWVPPHGASSANLVLRERGTDNEVAVPLRTWRASKAVGGLQRHAFRATLAWTDTLDAFVDPGTLDVSLEITFEHADTVRVRVPRPRTAGVVRMDPSFAVDGDRGHVFSPFFTFKAKRLSFTHSRLPRDVMSFIRSESRLIRARRAWARVRHPSQRPIWVIGERPDRFQDTAFAFFSWLSEHHPEIDARAVIDADSPDFDRAAAVGTVVRAGTIDHARTVLHATRIIGSHHPGYLYPLRTDRFDARVRGLRVFLQHGIMGTKWMADLYGRDADGFSPDLVIASSERERDLLVRDFGYRPRQIAVTGLSRFDTLMAHHPTPRKRLLVIPTWRDWLANPDDYAGSEYSREWHGLLSDPTFVAMCADAGLEVVLSLHPNMRRYVADFEDAGVTVMRPGEISVQDLLIDSAVVLTDYSSVGFDAALLHRPVLYFQFDRDRFLGRKGSHLDLDSDLPGDIAFTRAQVIGALGRVIGNGLQPSDENVQVADSYYPPRDQQANARIHAAIASAHRTRRLRITADARRTLERIATSGYRRLRRSDLYFPLARLVLRVASALPRDDRRVVFESGVGKQFGDSPRAIYEEVLRSRPDLRTVWAYNGRPANIGGGADVVKRLSLRYFVHLGRARFWVSNQSLPHYVHSDARRVYIQTWHGTPLKRMLHDLDVVTGRDSGYVERATTAAQQWSVLLSPNPHSSSVMRSAFQFDGDIVELGYPRNDVFFGVARLEAEARVRRAYRLSPTRRIVLFAPTFRDDQLGSASGQGPAGNIDPVLFARRFGADAVLLVRKHVLDRTTVVIPDEASSAVVDVSDYPDTQDLLAATDVLITDYSSLFFDFANLRRPMIFHVPDLDRYRDELRGFYLDMEKDLPGPLTRTDDEVHEAIETALTEGALPGFDIDAFAARYCPQDDGSASARVVETLMTDRS